MNTKKHWNTDEIKKKANTNTHNDFFSLKTEQDHRHAENGDKATTNRHARLEPSTADIW
jgi:hypothetical protein